MRNIGRRMAGIAATLFAITFAISGTAFAGEIPPTYDLKVAFDMPNSKIIGTATIDTPQGAELSISRGDLQIRSLTTGSIKLDPNQPDPIEILTDGPIRIDFEGVVHSKDSDNVSEDAIVLTDVWYPVVGGIYRYRLTVTLPQDFAAVSEADKVQRTESGGQATYSFDLPYPQRDWDGITFVASRQWASLTGKYKDIDLTVYLHHRNAQRLDKMLRDAQRYLEQLEGLLGPYPFQRLVIVENPLPFNYSLSMPTYVLLSQRSVTSLAPEDNALNHEIAHEWFGNGVLADYEGGNWAEGLASYFSDHLENERQGRAWERRQRMMNAYQNSVTDSAVLPLSEFTSSDDRASRFIGYAKSANVIHMLRRLVGDDEFFPAMRRFVTENLFRIASWTDIRDTFERSTGREFGWFFDQWVGETVLPELALDQVAVAAAGDKYDLRFALTQKPSMFLLDVPLTVYFQQGRSKTMMLPISDDRQEFHYLLDEKPVRIVLDENYDVFRRLTPAEMLPNIDTLLTRQRVTMFVSSGEEVKFRSLIDTFKRDGLPIAMYGWDRGGARKSSQVPGTRFRRPPWAQTGTPGVLPLVRAESAAVPAADINDSSLILLGADHPLIARLFGRVELPRGGFTVTVLKHPRSQGDVVAIFSASSKVQVDAAYDELVNHPPRYSAAAFDAGELIWSEPRQGQRGISHEMSIKDRLD